MRVRRKPVVVEAIQWLGTRAELPLWVLAAAKLSRSASGGWGLGIKTLGGDMTARPGDWIICGVGGEVYPCKPDIFSRTYEIAAEEPAAHSQHPPYCCLMARKAERERIRALVEHRRLYAETAMVKVACNDLLRWIDDDPEALRAAAESGDLGDFGHVG